MMTNSVPCCLCNCFSYWYVHRSIDGRRLLPLLRLTSMVWRRPLLILRSGKGQRERISYHSRSNSFLVCQLLSSQMLLPSRIAPEALPSVLGSSQQAFRTISDQLHMCTTGHTVTDGQSVRFLQHFFSGRMSGHTSIIVVLKSFFPIIQKNYSRC